MNQDTAEAITAALKSLVTDIAPDVRFVPKYGGAVFCPVPGNDTSFFGGIFTYKDHVSVEFSDGAMLDDPDGFLQGKGKKRRHLKFTAMDDITAQNTRAFLDQTVKAFRP